MALGFSSYSAQLFLQQPEGEFIEKSLLRGRLHSIITGISSFKKIKTSTMKKYLFFTIISIILFLPFNSVAQGFENIANTRTPLNITSQLINNTPKKAVAPTPPMGWNSWDNFGIDITEAEFKAQVDYVAKNLKQYGYEYMVVDAGWYAPHLSAQKDSPFYVEKITKYPTNVDSFGRWIPAVNKFPSASDGSFRKLADYVHSKGLKFGLHIQRGIPWSAIEQNLPIKGTNYHAKDIANPADACIWWDATLGVDMSKPGAQEYYNSCFELYASWGVDYVKVDDISRPYHADEITAIRMAIEKTGHNIVYSLSPGIRQLMHGIMPKTMQICGVFRMTSGILGRN